MTYLSRAGARFKWFLSAMLLVACGEDDPAGNEQTGGQAQAGTGGSNAGGAGSGGSGQSGADSGGQGGAAGQAGAPAQGCPAEGACIRVQAQKEKHPVASGVFGDQIQWYADSQHGQGFLDENGSLRQPWLDALAPLGLTLLRYPGGTPSDFFHWAEAVGPVAGRLPQVTPLGPEDGPKIPPLFGPDEMAQVAAQLKTDLLITVNVGTGTAEEAAGWLKYYKDKGVKATYWEIGNEIYYAGDGWAEKIQRRTPAEYASIFDSYAKALRAVDPSVKLGVLGCHDTGAFSLCHDTDWNAQVFAKVTEPFDFVSVHNSYAPAVGYNPQLEPILKATLAAPEAIRTNLEQQQADLKQYAAPINQGAHIAITEHASFLLPTQFDSIDTVREQMRLNRSISGALFSAASFQVFLEDERVIAANHINPISTTWQALATPSSQDFVSSPTRSAWGQAFALYAASAGGVVLAHETEKSPTFDSPQVGLVPALSAVPALATLAVKAPGGKAIWVYVINRSLDQEIEATVVIEEAVPTALSMIRMESNDPLAAVTPEDPGAVKSNSSELEPSAAPLLKFPPCSLTRLSFTIP